MVEKLRYISVDDEPLALSKIDEFAGQAPFLEKAGSFSNGLAAITFLNRNKVDLVFMDINMEGLDGLQTIELMNPRPQVIITTAYSQHALKGFDLDVCDYLLKPFSFERFVKSVTRALEKVSSPQTHVGVEFGAAATTNPYIFLRTSNKIQKVVLDQILFIKGMSDYLEVKMARERILVLMNFEEISKLLPKENFIRVHRSYILNVHHIDSIERNHVQIGEESIPVSQGYRDVFFLFLKNHGLG
nr:response regulator transcription factor [Bacteroidota bacterium]